MMIFGLILWRVILLKFYQAHLLFDSFTLVHLDQVNLVQGSMSLGSQRYFTLGPSNPPAHSAPR